MARVRTDAQKAAQAIRDKAYREANKEKCKARDAAKWERIKNNPDLLARERERNRLAAAKWRANNPEKAKALDIKYRTENPASRKAATAKWRQNNQDQYRQCQKKYRSENPDRFRIHAQNRRNLERGGSLSQGLVDKLIGLQRGKCSCCRVDLKKTKFHMDHILPLARGGEHADDNIQLLCQSCNQAKHAKHPVEFMQSRGMLL